MKRAIRTPSLRRPAIGLCLFASAIPLCAQTKTVTFELKRVTTQILQQPRPGAEEFSATAQGAGSSFTVQISYRQLQFSQGGTARFTLTAPGGVFPGTERAVPAGIGDLGGTTQFVPDNPAAFQVVTQYTPQPTDGSIAASINRINARTQLADPPCLPRATDTCSFTSFAVSTDTDGSEVMEVTGYLDLSLCAMESSRCTANRTL